MIDSQICNQTYARTDLSSVCVCAIDFYKSSNIDFYCVVDLIVFYRYYIQSVDINNTTLTYKYYI